MPKEILVAEGCLALCGSRSLVEKTRMNVSHPVHPTFPHLFSDIRQEIMGDLHLPCVPLYSFLAGRNAGPNAGRDCWLLNRVSAVAGEWIEFQPKKD